MTDALVVRETADEVGRYFDEHAALIRQKYAPNFTDAEFALFGEVARVRRLNPVSGHIYAFKVGEMVSFTPSIIGARLIAARTGEYAGADEVTFTGSSTTYGIKHPVKATATVYRMVKGVSCPFTASVDFVERAPVSRPLDRWPSSWKHMPKTMLAKCAEKAALARAFPEEFVGLDADLADREGAYGDDAPRPVRATIEDDRAGLVTLRDRLTDDQQEAMHNAAVERHILGITPVDTEQEPGTQTWQQVIAAIRGAYRARKAGTPDVRIASDGRLSVGNVFREMLNLEIVEAADSDGSEGDAS